MESRKRTHHKNDEKKKKERRRDSKSNNDHHLPTMIVFDLDDCLWTPEMHELYGKPMIPIKGDLNPHGASSGKKILQGVVGLSVPNTPTQQTVTLFEGARRVLYELVTNPIYEGIIIAVASSSLEPSYSYACLQGIEILPNLSMSDIISYDQVGRTGKLSSRKTTHFKELHQESGIPYDEMLFFDDCNWGDHCTDVSQAYGVVSQRTSSYNGLEWNDFVRGLEKYKQKELNDTEMVKGLVR